MKKRILFFVCSAFYTMALCQKPTITWGPELLKPKKSDISTLIGADRNSFYCLRATRSFLKIRQTAIEKYSKSTLTPQYVKEFRIPEVSGKDLTYEKSVLLKGRILVFASRYDKDLDKHILYLIKIIAEDGSVLNSPKEIDHIDAEKKRNRGSFEFVLSNDSTKLLIMHNEPYEKYENQKFSYKLLDSDGNSLWSTAFELPYKDKYFTLSDYIVDNDGKVFMLANILKEKSERERKRPTYTYDLICYDNSNKSHKEIPISLGDKYISDISFAIGPAANILVGGFYSNKNKDGLAGTFFLSVDKSKQAIINSGTEDFSTDFMSEFMSERRAKKNKEIYNYKIDYIVTKDNGGIYMVAEQYYINVVTTCNPKGGCTTTNYYCYNDIIVVNFNENASVKWVKHIPKRQVTANDYGYYSSYSFNASKGKLYFLFNDHPKNYSKPVKYPRNGISRKMVTVIASLDKDGNMERSTLFSAKEEKIYTRPKISMRFSSNQSLFYAIKKKKFKFGLISYP